MREQATAQYRMIAPGALKDIGNAVLQRGRRIHPRPVPAFDVATTGAPAAWLLRDAWRLPTDFSSTAL